jgi:hypothetical protein
MPEREKPIAPTVDWVVRVSAFDRTAVDNYIRMHRHYRPVMMALSGDYLSRMLLVKMIGTALGIPAFEEARTPAEIEEACRVNRERPVDESAEATGKPLVEMVVYKKGHKNSKGEPAPWTIVSCKTGKILSSHKSKENAEEHLKQMEYYKHAKTESIGDALVSGYMAILGSNTEDA